MSSASRIIDLRSDTVTRPGPAMRDAMFAAAVGDDQYGDDPTALELQEFVADLLGKEAALWVPSGTMGNQIALRLLTRPGDDVIVSRESHAVWHEAGGGGANAGVQFTEIGSGGRFDVSSFAEAIKPRGHSVFPPTTMVQVENTHNRAGGVVCDPDEMAAICQLAREKRIATYLDGARLWNAAVASNVPVAKFSAPFDLVMVSLSKGLGAPGGSLLAGSRELISEAVRHRRMLGGAMRQIGYFAAAGLYAIKHNQARLAEDHDNARLLASRLMDAENLAIDFDSVQTNIVVAELRSGAPAAEGFLAAARQEGVLINRLGPRTIRLITHLDVSRDDCERSAEVLVKILDR